MLNVALISPFSPGATSFLASAAVVQPQEGFTALIWMGASPLFSYLKTATALVAPRSGFRSTSVFSKTNAACVIAATAKKRTPRNQIRLPFMGESKMENAGGVKRSASASAQARQRQTARRNTPGSAVQRSSRESDQKAIQP